MNIGQSVKQLRRRNGFKQIAFAETIGISQTYMSQIESGAKIPSSDILQKIAVGLDMPLAIIFWYGLEEKDVRETKKEAYTFLKPSIDKMIESLI